MKSRSTAVEGGRLGGRGDTAACYACSTLDIFNCMIKCLDYFLCVCVRACKITLEQVLHDLSITMPFVTTEKHPFDFGFWILFGLNPTLLFFFFFKISSS